MDGGQQLRLDLHDAGHHSSLRQHSLPCQDHVGKSFPDWPELDLFKQSSSSPSTSAGHHQAKSSMTDRLAG